MATIGQQKLKIVSDPHNIRVESFPEAASQSFEANEFVYLVSGKVTVCATDATSILGVSMVPATGTTDTMIEVALADENLIVEMNKTGAVSAITDPSAGPYALTLSSHKWYVDTTDTDHDSIRIIGLSKRDAVGDTYGRVLCRVIPGAFQVPAA